MLPPSPSLLNLEIKNPAISLRTIETLVKARVGVLDVEITPAPLTVIVKQPLPGVKSQKLVFDEKTRTHPFQRRSDARCRWPGLVRMKLPGERSGPIGIQFDRRGGAPDVDAAGWGAWGRSVAQSSRYPQSAPAWGLFDLVASGCRSI